MIWALYAIVGAFLTLFLHELSHAIVIWFRGGTVTEFKPWPHFNGGQFYFGWTGWEIEESKVRPAYAAPVIKAILMGAGWGALWSVLDHGPLLVLAGWEVADLLWWGIGMARGEHTDARKFTA